jgi:hypothetical protein
MNHSLMIKALAAHALVHRAKESKVQRESLSEVIGELLPAAEDVKDHRLDVIVIYVAINQTFLNLGVFYNSLFLIKLTIFLV